MLGVLRRFQLFIWCVVATACGASHRENEQAAGGVAGADSGQGGAVSLGGSGLGGRLATSGGSPNGGASSGGASSGGASATAGGSLPIAQGGVSGTSAGTSGGVSASGGVFALGGASGGGAAHGGASASGGVTSAAVGGTSNGPITVWLAGDSTMANGETPCPVGWGKRFAPYFQNNVTVTNSAVGGRSIHTWLYNVLNTTDASGECDLEQTNGMPTLQARWTAILSGMKPGDYLLIQFGINDGDTTCPRHVGLDAFKASLELMASAAKQRGASPIFLTPVSAIACNGSTPRGTRGGYVTATIEAGAASAVPVIDLHALSVALYTSLGFCPIPGGDVSASTTGPVGTFFCDDHTHFDTPGADQIAGVVAKALRDQNIPLASYLK